MTSEQSRSGSNNSMSPSRPTSWSFTVAVMVAAILYGLVGLAQSSTSTADVPPQIQPNTSAAEAPAQAAAAPGSSNRVFFRNERWFRLGPPPMPSMELAVVLVVASGLLLLSASRLLRWRGSVDSIRHHAGLRLEHYADPGVQRMMIDRSKDRRLEIRIDRYPDAGIQNIRLLGNDGPFEEYCHA